MLALAGGASGAAQAATVTLDVDGAYRELAPHVYFVPGGGAVGLRGTLLDDAGAADGSCLVALRQPFGAPAFVPDDGIWCPPGDDWTGGFRVTENVRLKAAVVPDARNSAAESPVLTLLTAPALTWSGARGTVRFRVAGGADGYAGLLAVRSGGRVVARARVMGGAARSVRVRIARRYGRCTATLTPADPERWAAVIATGRPRRGRSGEARPVSPPAPPA